MKAMKGTVLFNHWEMNGQGIRKWFWYVLTEIPARLLGGFSIDHLHVHSFRVTQFDLDHFALARLIKDSIDSEKSDSIEAQGVFR